MSFCWIVRDASGGVQVEGQMPRRKMHSWLAVNSCSLRGYQIQ